MGNNNNNNNKNNKNKNNNSHNNSKSSGDGGTNNVTEDWRKDILGRLGDGYFSTQHGQLLFDPKAYIEYRGLKSDQSDKLILKWTLWMQYFGKSDNRSLKDAAKRAEAMTRQHVQEVYKTKILDQHHLDLLKSATGQLQGASREVSMEMKERRGAIETRTEITAKTQTAIESISAASPTTAEVAASPSSMSSSSVQATVPISTKLTPGAIKRMQDEFSRNFSAYKGEPWILSTGTNVDEAMHFHTLTLNVESSLHSFVLDTGNRASLRALRDSDDQELVKTICRKERRTLPLWMKREIALYALEPAALEELLSHGWAHFVDCAEDLGHEQSEAFYALRVWNALVDGLLKNIPDIKILRGEKCSQSSSVRKNEDRDLETKKALGRRIDGIFVSRRSNLEFGAIEAGKKNEGTTGTKVLTDARKLAKLLKDMMNHIF
ncbi:hypothetical protein BGZ58_001582 [Dissophora ornata]|nr:hypothetical protein BGZ58_001582 [Dissophora ornata]